jgi:hypothetical protein
MMPGSKKNNVIANTTMTHVVLIETGSEEGMIEAHGDDVAPGFRLCSSPAKTILDSGDDQGNFLGVAVYVDGELLYWT